MFWPNQLLEQLISSFGNEPLSGNWAHLPLVRPWNGRPLPALKWRDKSSDASAARRKLIQSWRDAARDFAFLYEKYSLDWQSIANYTHAMHRETRKKIFPPSKRMWVSRGETNSFFLPSFLPSFLPFFFFTLTSILDHVQSRNFFHFLCKNYSTFIRTSLSFGFVLVFQVRDIISRSVAKKILSCIYF